MNLLTLVIFLPLLGALALTLVPREEVAQHRALAFVVSLATFLLSLGLWFGFDSAPQAAEFQFETFLPWVPSLGIGYHVGLDGVALLLLMLTTVLTPVVLLSAWKAIGERVKEFLIAILVLETAMIGPLPRWTSSCSTCSGRRCWCRCTCSSASGVPRTGSTRR